MLCVSAQEQLRLEALEAEQAELTFAPAINPCYSIVSRPLLDLADPAPYLEHANTQRRRLEAARQQAAVERKVRGSFLSHLSESARACVCVKRVGKEATPSSIKET